MTGKILLIEDDDILGSTITDLLHLEGYHLDWVTDGEKGLKAAQRSIHDLVILDIMLPHKNGFEVLAELRQSSDIPVLILSAKSELGDRIKGLKLKADDYLGKPFHLEELLLRVEALLRRANSVNTTYLNIQLGNAEIDFNQRQVKHADNVYSLSEKEADILRLLFSHAGKVVSRDEILDRVWGSDEFPSNRSVDNFISNLRKYIEQDPSQPHYIRSQRGVGYFLYLED